MHRCFTFVAIAMAMAIASAFGEVPTTLQPPGSPMLVGSFHAAGVQIYGCDPSGKWVLRAPEAELSDNEGARVIHHSAGPSWEAKDGSKIVGKLLAKAPAPSADAIPWLLVATTSSGSGLLGEVRYVQRLDTIGGVAPAGGCSAGQEQRVPYAATYTFYR